MKTAFYKLSLLLLALCLLTGCEKKDFEPLRRSSYPDDYSPDDYVYLYFPLCIGLNITNSQGEILCVDSDEPEHPFYFSGNMNFYYYSPHIGSSIYSVQVHSSEYYLFEYTKNPARCEWISLSSETNNFNVIATEIKKAVLFRSDRATLDGDLSEFSVSCTPYGENREIILTGSGKDHVEVFFENGTLVAEGEEVEYSVTEEAV